MLVLVDRGRAEQLGRFVRTVLAIEPNTEVMTSALGFARAEPGSAIVLLPNVAEAAWMNQERPVLASRRLRVMLFCDEGTSAEVARKAPDFFHWTSHWMEAPQGAWPPAVQGLRAAERRGEPVAWVGGDLEGCFSEAFSGVEPVRQSASKPYLEMLDAFRNEERWIVVTDVDGAFRLRRVKWAIGESGRKGKLVLLEPKADPSGFAQVHARMMAPKEAEKRLAEAGAKHAGRLAAILDCEEEVVDLAVRLLRGGAPDAEVEGVWQDEAPRAGIFRLAEKYGVETPRAEVASFSIGDWLAAAEKAVEVGDAEVGEHWARKALETGERRADGLLVLARALVPRGALDEARLGLEEVIDKAAGEDKDNLMRRLRAYVFLSTINRARGDLKAARKAIDAALRISKRLSEADQDLLFPTLRYELAEVLWIQRDLKGAKKEAEIALSRATDVGDDGLIGDILDLVGRIRIAEHDYRAAKMAFEKALSLKRQKYGDDSVQVGNCLGMLGTIALLNGESGGNAVELLDAAVNIFRKNDDRRLMLFILRLGNALSDVGDIDRAEECFVEACNLMADSELSSSDTHVEALYQLAGIFTVQNRLGEAMERLEEARDIVTSQYRYGVLGAKVDENIARILLQTGKSEQGRILLDKAHRTFLRKLGPADVLTKHAADLLSRVAPPDHAPRK